MFDAVEDYPQDLLDLEARFSTEEACRAYLFQLRWPIFFNRTNVKSPDVAQVGGQVVLFYSWISYLQTERFHFLFEYGSAVAETGAPRSGKS